MPASFPGRSKQAPHRPEMFDQWAERFPNADTAVSGAIKALVEGYRGFAKDHARIAADETATDGARLVRSAKLARSKILPLVNSLDAAKENAAKHRAQLEAKVAEVYNPPNPTYAAVLRHQEIRSYLRALPLGDKYKVVAEARKRNDEDTLIALAGAPDYLSGLPEQYHQHIRDELVETHAPQQAATLKLLQEQQALAENFRAEMLQSVSNVVDFAKADELISAAKEDVAA